MWIDQAWGSLPCVFRLGTQTEANCGSLANSTQWICYEITVQQWRELLKPINPSRSALHRRVHMKRTDEDPVVELPWDRVGSETMVEKQEAASVWTVALPVTNPPSGLSSKKGRSWPFHSGADQSGTGRDRERLTPRSSLCKLLHYSCPFTLCVDRRCPRSRPWKCLLMFLYKSLHPYTNSSQHTDLL